jgi:hypothetical protein
MGRKPLAELEHGGGKGASFGRAHTFHNVTSDVRVSFEKEWSHPEFPLDLAKCGGLRKFHRARRQ